MTGDSDSSREGSEESLTERTRNAAQWHVATGIITGAMQFLVGIILARLIPPEDFGLLALAFIFVGFAALFSNLGIAPSVIQREELTEAHVRVAFTLSILLGFAMALVVFLLAPLAMWVFQEPGLPAVIRVLSLTFVISGVGATAGALMRRSLDFKTNFFLAVSSNGGGYALVGTIMAFLGFGVWSLVGAVLAKRVVETGFLLIAVRRPPRPLLRMKETRDLTSFGVGFSLNSMMGYLARTGDNFVVGRWLGAEQLGFYTRAYGLSMLPHDHVGQAAISVLFPAMSGVQGEPDRLRRAFYTSVQLAAILALPVLAGMAVAAPHIIIGLYGEEWAGAVVPMQLLTVLGALSTISGLGVTVVNAVGRPYAVMVRTLVYAALVVTLGLAGTRWGTPGVATGVGLASAYLYISINRLALRAVGGDFRSFAVAHVPAVLLAVAVAGASWSARWLLLGLEAPDLAILFALILVCAVTALATFRLLPRSTRFAVVDQVSATYRRRLPPRFASVIDRLLLGQ